jgi:DNA primase
LGRYYSEEIIQRILDKADIIEVISELVPIKKAGAKHYKGLCPFHSEKTPSFTVHRDRQFFYCFGCQTGGNVVHFLMKAKGLTFGEAIEELAQRYQIDLPKDSIPYEAGRGKERKVLLEINELVAQFFHENLLSSRGKEAIKYLTRRGVRMEEIKVHRLGYALGEWDGLISFLQKRDIPLNLAEKLGLIIPKNGGGYYDRFRYRIMFPVMTDRGEVIGFGARSIGDGNPKYMNSPESILYKKGESLYGLQVAKRAIIDKDSVIFVEGYFDLITMNRFDIWNVVATCGTALTSGHLRTIKRWTQNVTLIFDSDEAGQKGAMRSLELILSEGINAKVILLPAGEDPDSLLNSGGEERFRKMMGEAIPLMDFFINRVIKEEDSSTPKGKIRALEVICPMLRKIRHPIEMDYYVQKVAEILKVKENRVFAMVKGEKDAEECEGEEIQVGVDLYGPEKLLVQLMLHKNDMIPLIIEEGIVKDFQSIPLKRVSEKIISIYESRGSVDLRQLSILLQDKEDIDIVSELAFCDEKIVNSRKILNDCVVKIRKNKINKEIERLKEDIKRTVELKDDILMNSIIKRLNELREERKKILIMR